MTVPSLDPARAATGAILGRYLLYHTGVECGEERWRIEGTAGGMVDYATHLFNTLVLARRDFQVWGEHEFPVLRVGPPLMAVTPDRMLYRCAEKGTFTSPQGPVPAGRYVVTLPSHEVEEGYTFWADEDGIVLESYDGLDPVRPWMRLVEYRREGPS